MMKTQLSFRCLHTCAIAALAVVYLAMAPEAVAQTQAPEAELKAAIISNMLLFVEWPTTGSTSAPGDRLVVCFQEPSPVADALLRLDGKSVKGKSLKVMQVSSSDAGGCHALYLAPGSAANLDTILPGLSRAPILVTADSPDYAKRGVMLNLDLAGGRVVFDIDLRSAQKAGLQISSKVLRLARQVIE